MDQVAEQRCAVTSDVEGVLWDMSQSKRQEIHWQIAALAIVGRCRETD